MFVGRMGIRGVVGVVGGAETTTQGVPGEATLSAAKALGKALGALQSAHLLTGGADGVVKAVSEGFYSVHPRSGIILGVLSNGAKGAAMGNEFIEIPLYTPVSGDDPTAPGSPGHITALTSDVLIALPGGDTTLAEVELGTKAKYRYNKPTILFLPDAADTVGGKNAAALKRSKYTVATSVDQVVEFVKAALGL